MLRVLVPLLIFATACGQHPVKPGDYVPSKGRKESQPPLVPPEPTPVARVPEPLKVAPDVLRHKVGEWVTRGQVRVRVKEVKIFPLERIFWIGLEVQNLSETRKFDFHSWGSTDSTLTDEFDNRYSIYRDHVPLLNGGMSVHPESTQFCLIQAEAPITKAQIFHLWLDGLTIYSDTGINFTISRSNISP